MNVKSLVRKFDYIADRPDDTLLLMDIRSEIFDCALVLNALCPDTRETYMAIEQLELALFWAQQSVLRETQRKKRKEEKDERK